MESRRRRGGNKVRGKVVLHRSDGLTICTCKRLKKFIDSLKGLYSFDGLSQGCLW